MGRTGNRVRFAGASFRATAVRINPRVVLVPGQDGPRLTVSLMSGQDCMGRTPHRIFLAKMHNHAKFKPASSGEFVLICSRRFCSGCVFKLAWPVVKNQNGSPQGAAAEGGLLAHVCRWNAAPIHFGLHPLGWGGSPVPGSVGREGQGFSPTLRARRGYRTRRRLAPHRLRPQRRVMPI